MKRCITIYRAGQPYKREHAVSDSELREGYYGYECPICDELVYPYGCAPWDEEEE